MEVKNIAKMDFQLSVQNPFIIAFHHKDLFPKGNGNMAPDSINPGENIGEDFDMKSPWRMYYGDRIPGFPVHPHRGFETVTVMLDGFADHFDAKGAKGRYGKGDVQWMTAGAGTQHSEMFPLLNDNDVNPMELFQIWLNLPKKNKFASPDYKMFWNEDIPVVVEYDNLQRKIEVKLIAGEYKGIRSLDPVLASWAYDRNNHVGIWLITLEANADFIIPGISRTLNRALYNFGDSPVMIDGHQIKDHYYAELLGDVDIHVNNGDKATQLLLLEGEPIKEPIAARGPFVMNTESELRQAFSDYRSTQFGGWPWDQSDPVNEKSAGRFASYNFGERIEYPD